MPTRSRVSESPPQAGARLLTTGYHGEKLHLGVRNCLSGRGCYHLVIRVRRGARITVGALGPLEFKKGFYGYTGSARGGFAARVGRHLRAKKKVRWHVDFLLGCARVVEVWLNKSRRGECSCHMGLGVANGAVGAVPRFGSSDCDCASHLWRYRGRPRGPVGWEAVSVKRRC